MEKETLVLEGVGEGGCILKIVIAKRVQFSYVILLSLFFLGGGGAKFRYTTCHATLLERSIV